MPPCARRSGGCVSDGALAVTGKEGKENVDRAARDASCLEQPHWRPIAVGYDIERWYDEDRGETNGSMLMPRRVSLSVGPPSRHLDVRQRFVPDLASGDPGAALRRRVRSDASTIDATDPSRR